MRKFYKIALLSASVLLSGALVVQVAAADEHGQVEHSQNKGPAPARPAPGYQHAPAYGRAPPAYDAHGQVLDSRYNHGRYYPPVGTVRPALPPEYHPYFHHGSPYYFSGGIWYAPRGPGFVVVGPPVGIIISTLPPYYSTVWIGGVPYYYADSVYYTWQPQENGYAVVDPPGDADAPSPPPNTGQMDLIIYPKNGQSKEQQAADQYECHNWAKGQTGFDPTQPGGGNSDVNRSNYNRAMSACLQARGYQVN
ncbi:MAG TPA: DUF6515 family protein [Steroidobacteraceae bacterium]|jgi:hypothetical protein|nr:DUF6515 family protein [Steroidobacteraceae bacterium]